MILDIDVGNSRIKWRVGATRGFYPRGEVANFPAGVAPNRIRVSSVSTPAFDATLAKSLRELYGVAPEFETIADGSYPVSRPLFFYVKKAHVGVIPGTEAFLKEFTSERAWGPDGYLVDKGLIPMPDEEREKLRKDAVGLANNVMM